MINRTAIQQWSEHAPWIDNAQIEHDLIICRALVSIFSDEFLASQLAFRGGTALHKLYLSPTICNPFCVQVLLLMRVMLILSFMRR